MVPLKNGISNVSWKIQQCQLRLFGYVTRFMKSDKDPRDDRLLPCYERSTNMLNIWDMQEEHTYDKLLSVNVVENTKLYWSNATWTVLNRKILIFLDACKANNFTYNANTISFMLFSISCDNNVNLWIYQKLYCKIDSKHYIFYLFLCIELSCSDSINHY